MRPRSSRLNAFGARRRERAMATDWMCSQRPFDAYEEHYPMDPPDPIEAIKFRMEQQGLTRRDLEEIIGTRTRIAEVLNRKRGLSVRMIRRLHERLGISAEVLIRPSQKKPREQLVDSSRR